MTGGEQKDARAQPSKDGVATRAYVARIHALAPK
jgi:hypothetical protein